MSASALSDLLKSEKGLFCGLLVVAGSVLTATGNMSVSEWQEYTLYLAGIYTGGKAMQGAAAAIGQGQKVTPAEAAEAIDKVRTDLEASDRAADAAASKLPTKKGGSK